MQLARWHQTAGVRFATAARNLANYPRSCVFPPGCRAEIWRTKYFAANRDEQDRLTGTEVLDTRRSAVSDWAHSYRSAVPPRRANILRQETHASFTCAKAHAGTLTFSSRLLWHCSVSLFCSSVRRVEAAFFYAQGWLKRLLLHPPDRCTLTSASAEGRLKAGTEKAIWSACPPLTAKTMIKGRSRRGRIRTGESAAPFLVTFANPLRRSTRLLQTYFVCLCRLDSHVLPTQLSLLSPVRLRSWSSSKPAPLCSSIASSGARCTTEGRPSNTQNKAE